MALLSLTCCLQGQTDSSTKTSRKEPEQREPEVYTMVEEMAEYPGGIQAMGNFIKTNIIIPKEVSKDKIAGKVFLKFIVFEDGTIKDVNVLKGVTGCEACDKESVRVIQMMPTWTPAKINGKPVKCYYTLPISFKP